MHCFGHDVADVDIGTFAAQCVGDHEPETSGSGRDYGALATEVGSQLSELLRSAWVAMVALTAMSDATFDGVSPSVFTLV
jgi:hypothetical protein